MKSKLTYLTSLAAIMSGMLIAQTPAPPSAPPAAPHHRWNQGQRFDRFAAQLNLTDDQKTQAKTILEASRESSATIAQQLRQSRQALRDSVKSGKSEADIDQLSANLGQLTGQMAPNRTKAYAKVWALLTPEQKEKAGHIRGMFMGGHEHGHGSSAGQ